MLPLRILQKYFKKQPDTSDKLYMINYELENKSVEELITKLINQVLKFIK